ncbi:hypothetical protein EVAR_55071_1 [Eumeta japonica]|uniref:Uncharacterized protein n=1 Tax=Eumeta variegata TaxID=151549 RepID=A0A4C1YZH2_EUMVA|nr:hypothetical protein EVAR_55071_1 [Eumeta japonica]
MAATAGVATHVRAVHTRVRAPHECVLNRFVVPPNSDRLHNKGKSKSTDQVLFARALQQLAVEALSLRQPHLEGLLDGADQVLAHGLQHRLLAALRRVPGARSGTLRNYTSEAEGLDRAVEGTRGRSGAAHPLGRDVARGRQLARRPL